MPFLFSKFDLARFRNLDSNFATEKKNHELKRVSKISSSRRTCEVQGFPVSAREKSAIGSGHSAVSILDVGFAVRPDNELAALRYSEGPAVGVGQRPAVGSGDGAVGVLDVCLAVSAGNESAALRDGDRSAVSVGQGLAVGSVSMAWEKCMSKNAKKFLT